VPTTADATPPKQDGRVIRTQATVLAAGIELYAERGAQGITVEEIARRTGIAKTTIYRHWRSREELIMAILEQTAVGLPDVHTDDPIGDIRSMLLSLWTNLVLPTSRVGLAGMITATAGDPQLASQHRDFLTTRAAPLLDAVTRAIDTGVVEAAEAPQTLTDLLSSPIIVRALIRGDAPERRYVDRVMKAVLGAPPPRTTKPRRER
jgi:AcrR family transcriptional regulator